MTDLVNIQIMVLIVQVNAVMGSMNAVSVVDLELMLMLTAYVMMLIVV